MFVDLLYFQTTNELYVRIFDNSFEIIQVMHTLLKEVGTNTFDHEQYLKSLEVKVLYTFWARPRTCILWIKESCSKTYIALHNVFTCVHECYADVHIHVFAQRKSRVAIPIFIKKIIVAQFTTYSHNMSLLL